MPRCLALVFCSALTACVSPPPPYPGPATLAFSALEIKVEGLTPGDYAWFSILEPTQPKHLGTLHLTKQAPSALINLDHGKQVLLGFSSMKPHMGGYTACAGDVPFNAKADERYAINFTTLKWSCTIVLSKAIGSGSFVQVAQIDGAVSGVQVKIGY